MFIIDDNTPIEQEISSGHAFGCVPRDFSVQPRTVKAVQFPLIPRSEWSERIRDMEATKSRLSDIRNTGDNGGPIRSYDQNGQGYCWAYSTTAAVTLLRAKANMPHVRLSAHAVACKIKNFRDEGAWGALSMEFISKNGVPSEAAWPAKSMSRSNDNAATWADAAKHKITEGWADLEVEAWDRNMTFDQIGTLLLSRIPVVLDFAWWGHSVCGMDLVETSPGQFGVRIWNSWTDSWGDNGTGVLAGSKAIPMGASAPLVTNA
tara:strand:- start:4 stop:789 length:786 start_codon:yes stop_codon:yes gene_type:complete